MTRGDRAIALSIIASLRRRVEQAGNMLARAKDDDVIAHYVERYDFALLSAHRALDVLHAAPAGGQQ